MIVPIESTFRTSWIAICNLASASKAALSRELAKLSGIYIEEIIIENDFGDNCLVVYVLFDDWDYTNQDIAIFRAGHAGWQYGGKIVLLDSNERPYSVVVNRINRIVELKAGDVEILFPRDKDEMLF